MLPDKNGIDSKQMISLGIFTLVFVAFMYYFQSKQQPLENPEPAPTEQVTQQKGTDSQQATPTDENTAIPTEEQTVSLSNKELALEFSSKGGQISKVEIKGYDAYTPKGEKPKPVLLFNQGNAHYGFVFTDKNGNKINTKNLNFAPTVSGNQVFMDAVVDNAKIRYTYTLNDDYSVDFRVNSTGLSQVTSGSAANFEWDYKVHQIEKGRSQEVAHTEFGYAFADYKSYDYDQRGDMKEPKETLNWVAIKQQFFTATIENPKGFKNSVGHQDMIEKGEFLKEFTYDGGIDLAGGELNQDLKWYFQPLKYKLLKSYGKNFDKIIPFGWSFIGSVNRHFFLPVYNWLSSFGIAAGWVIFLMTIAVKIVLSPVMYKQYKLSAMMRVIRPEVMAAQEKYKDADAMKKQQATMEVYRKAGVNQFAGCIPGLLQAPLFYALFRFFPNVIELRGKSFWFAEDLTAYDEIIHIPQWIPFMDGHISVFAIACTIALLIYTILNAGNIQQPTQPGMPNMKVIMYIFPITFLFFLNNYASGLSWYYFVSNTLNIFLIFIITYVFLDEKKIHAQIQENKAKPKKEGKFQSRMREMMEKAQEQQKQMEAIKQQQKKKR